MLCCKCEIFLLLVVFGFTSSHRHLSLQKFKPNLHWYKSSRRNSFDGVLANYEHLPDTITPLEYYIKILPKLKDPAFQFVGEIMILMYINKETNHIVVSSVNLNFNLSTIGLYKTAKPNGKIEHIKVISVRTGNGTEQVIITVEKPLEAGYEYNIVINYTGTLSDNMLGFYRSWYIDETGEMRLMAVTNMELTYARTVFPCFDELRFRTPFTIQIGRLKESSTISVTPTFMSTLPDPKIDNRVWDIYQKTAPIPTHLVGFCVFDLHPIRGERINVWAQPKAVDQTEYILNKTEEIISTLSDFTWTLFDLPKLDIVIVPDYSTDGADNFGITMMRERNALYKPSVSTTLDKQTVFTTTVSKLAHHWFGNLITPKWWNYVWLNEAFANYLKYYITSLMEPSWRTMDQFVVRELHVALSEDVGHGHPLNSYLLTPTFTDDVFDVYFRRKGCSILRMLESFLGTKNFQSGVKNFLRYGIYKMRGVVTPTTFWNAIGDIMPQYLLPEDTTIYHIMDSWTRQRGYPLVTITRNYTAATALIQQEEFLIPMKMGSTSKLQWWIPLSFTYSGQTSTDGIEDSYWLKPNNSLTISTKTDRWIVFNTQQTGYYRVNYDEQNWNLLTDQLITNHTLIHPINRAQIIDDSFALAEAGVIRYDIPISISYYLLVETDFIPWHSAIRVFRKLLEHFHGTSEGVYLKAYLQHLIKPIYDKVMTMPPENQTHVNKLLKQDVVSFACDIGLNRCELKLLAQFNEWVTSKSSYVLEPEIKEAALCTAIKHGTSQTWKDVWAYYKQSNVLTEKFQLLRALACSTDVIRIRKYLNLLTASKPPLDIRLQDYKHVFNFIVSHPWNTANALMFVIENYKLFKTDAKIQILKSFFESLGEAITTKEDYEPIEQFYNNTKEYLEEDNVNATLYNALVRIRCRIEWKSGLNASEIVEYLNLMTRDVDFANGVDEVTTTGKDQCNNCSTYNIIIMNRSSSTSVHRGSLDASVYTLLITIVWFHVI